MAGRRTNVRAKSLVHYLGLGLSAGLLAFVALIAALVIVVPAASGSTPYTILTTSMEPGMPPGTLIIVKPTDPQAIQIGDVVTYQVTSNEPAVITHRVIQIIESSTEGAERRFVTQGDNNGSPDGEIKAVQIRGVVWYAVPWIGYVNNLVNGDSRSIVIPIVAIALFGYAGWMVVSSILGRRRKKLAAERRLEREEREAREARAARRYTEFAPDDARELAPGTAPGLTPAPSPSYLDAPPPGPYPPSA
jgi:signal peptidase